MPAAAAAAISDASPFQSHACRFAPGDMPCASGLTPAATSVPAVWVAW